MRNAFVVLVSLCIGLVSGFSVPQRIPESTTRIARSSRSNTDSTTKKCEVPNLSSTIASKLFVLPRNRNNIDEKDLYEHATEKQNNQSVRAFIFINQKYKKPARNRLHQISADIVDKVRHMTAPMGVTHSSTPCSKKSGGTGYINTYFQGYYPDKESQVINSYFAPPINNMVKCNLDDDKKTKESESIKPYVNIKADERRDYFELLKPPILRPVHRALNTKTNYISSQSGLTSLPSSSLPYKDYSYLKKLNIKNHKKMTEDGPVETRRKYGFNHPYVANPPHFRHKDVIRTEDFDGDFGNDEDSHKNSDNQEEDKLLDKYLQDTLEEQTMIDKAVHSIDCSYQDCVLQSTRQYSNHGTIVKPECKCGRWLNIKQGDPFSVKDRSLREEGKHNDTIAKSTEINYYEEMLTDDTSNKFDDDVIRPPKSNETLH